jgi:hypothetical protein
MASFNGILPVGSWFMVLVPGQRKRDEVFLKTAGERARQRRRFALPGLQATRRILNAVLRHSLPGAERDNR